ncbi:hypothetical protein M9H77_12642 [Catharanthus roseus]|uniref:Uncharacterized protein n=1 Tax=Catharanthus roseus TaxID=4058 RepID=A0ACC0BI70_CATRO|nr:hypothetical protein M9H77_12642 [Catharanthus roseus]
MAGESENMFPELLKAQTHLSTQIFSFRNSASLKCAVELGIADAIENHGKPMTLTDLSATLPINPSKAQYIPRLMRMLVTSGFFIEQKLAPDDQTSTTKGYVLTTAGRLLLKDDPMNGSAVVLMELDPAMVKPWNLLSEWFKNEDPTPFYTAHGKNFWDYNAQEPRLRTLFNDAMDGYSQLITNVVTTHLKFVFEGLKSIVDVGGATGSDSIAIAKAVTGLKCTVFDLPQAFADLKDDPKLENVEFVPGSMFEEIPQSNAILLKWILHNWNDESCLKILKNCKKAIPEKEKGGRIIIIDMVVKSQNGENETDETLQASLDMQMIVLYTAKERTEEEWAKLFRDSGFSDYKIYPVLDFSSLIEVYP